MKRILLIIIALIIFNECYFFFIYQDIAWQKVRQNQKLNTYELVNTYIIYNLVELSGLVISPQTSKMMFCKQFHLPLNYSDVPTIWEKNANVRNSILSLKSGETKRLVWKDYISSANFIEIVKRWKDNDVALALNGSKINCISRDNESITVKFTIYTDFAPQCIKVMGITTPEGLFDYLENENIISTPKAEIIKTYKLADLK